MKVKNETEWRGADLRAIITRVVKDETDPATRKRLHITVRYRRKARWLAEDTYVSGNAYIGSPQFPGTIRILVTKHGIDPVDFAHTVAHEIAHARGIKHEGMRGSIRYERVDGHREWYAWAEAMPIRKVEPRRKAKPTADDRLALAQRRVKEWTTRLRRAETGLKRWQRRVRDLERRAASATENDAA